MLVLTRTSGSLVVLRGFGAEIMIVFRRKNDQCVLTLIGPKEFTFLREELGDVVNRSESPDPDAIGHLTVSRKRGEGVVIVGLGKIRFVAMRGSKLRMGFEFPNAVEVVRDDVWEGPLPYDVPLDR